MLDVARKKRPLTELEDVPQWMRELKGFEEMVAANGEASHAGDFDFPSGVWSAEMYLPNDLADFRDFADPITVLIGLNSAAEHVNSKLTQVVAYCRAEGKTWTQIGEALGMSKQAAWERFSGED